MSVACHVYQGGGEGGGVGPLKHSSLPTNLAGMCVV